MQGQSICIDVKAEGNRGSTRFTQLVASFR